MSKQASEFQKKLMGWFFRGKDIFKPLNTGFIDDRVFVIREWVANIFFYKKGKQVIMIDAGYNYDRLAEKMRWLNLDPQEIDHILITHQDTDHVGAIEIDSDQLFEHSTIYIGDIENKYLTGATPRKVLHGLYRLPQVAIQNKKVLLHDGQVFYLGDMKIECIAVPGHTWGHVVYLIDDHYLFTGDTIWFGADGGYSFISSLAEDNRLAIRSLVHLEKILRERGGSYKIITGHTGWTDSIDFAFAHSNEVCSLLKRRLPDNKAPFDGYDESDDTEERALKEALPKKIFRKE